MKVTYEWIHANKTPAGGFTRKQIECLGLRWPIKRGWITRVEGLEISEEKRLEFESIGKTGRLVRGGVSKRNGVSIAARAFIKAVQEKGYMNCEDEYADMENLIGVE